MNDCILSTYAKNHRGYGRFKVDGVQHNHSRVVYAEHHKIPLKELEGKVVRHTCHNPPCINPAHLRLGTNQDNSDDMVAAGRQGGGRPVRMSPEQVREIRQMKGEYRQIAKQYNISIATVSFIMNRQGRYNYE